MWSEKLCVHKKQIHYKDILTSNDHFQPKYHNNASSSEKVHPWLSSHIKIHRYICLELFCTGFACK